MQNITLTCETLMLESIKHTDLHISHATTPIHDCCISFFINEFSRLYTLVSSFYYGFLHLVVFLTGISSGSISRASQ